MNGTHEDQVVWQPADQLRGAPGNVRQHEPPLLPGGLSGPSWRRAPATGAPGLCAVAGLQRIASADESAATSPPLETSVAGRMRLAGDRSFLGSMAAGRSLCRSEERRVGEEA